jgi:hypothetical protein
MLENHVFGQEGKEQRTAENLKMPSFVIHTVN